MGKSATPSFVTKPTEPSAPVELASDTDLLDLQAAAEPADEWVSLPWLPPLLKPKVAIPTALGAAAAGALVGLAGGSFGVITLIMQIALAALLVVLTATDLLVQRLPDTLVLPAYVVAGIGTAAAVIAGEISWHQAMVAATCMVGAYILFFAIAYFTGGMGQGDAKLAGLIGLILGLQGIGNAIAGTFMLPSLVTVPILLVVLLVKRDMGRKSVLPFGPMLAAGAILALAIHQQVSDMYTVLSWQF